MLKLASFALGLLAVVMVAPSSQSATFQNQPTLSRINGKLYVQKLVPMKRSVNLRTTVIEKTPVQAPIDRKIELSQESKESQRIKNGCQGLVDDRQRFGANERPIRIPDNSSTSNTAKTPDFSNSFNGFNNFNRSTYSGDCNFSGKF